MQFNLTDVKNLKVAINELYDDSWAKKDITLSILRLDQIHPVVSGNKIFKLQYFLQEALKSNKKIITFGGAYSNHLAATAAACSNYRIESIGVVRGERPPVLSTTLSYCLEQGMHLEFISRNDYKKKNSGTLVQALQLKFGDHVLIPEGGFSKQGVKGAEAIYNYFDREKYTHICCAVGTATTLAAFTNGANATQQVVGFSTLKRHDFEERVKYLTGDLPHKNYYFINEYHFGGYAKMTGELITFMNSFYDQFLIPLDFVYNAKMMYGTLDLIKKNFFAAGSRILCIHTGGLQGNCSLSPGVLKF